MSKKNKTSLVVDVAEYVEVAQVPGLPKPEKTPFELLSAMPAWRSLRLPKSKYDLTKAQISGLRGIVAKKTGTQLLHTDDAHSHYFTRVENTESVVVRVDKKAKKAERKTAVNHSNFPVLTKLPKRYNQLIEEMIATSGGVRIRKKAFKNPGARGGYMWLMKKFGYKIDGSKLPSSKYIVISGKRGAVKPTFRKSYTRTTTKHHTHQTHVPTTPAVIPPAPEQTSAPEAAAPQLTPANA